jgi:transposase
VGCTATRFHYRFTTFDQRRVLFEEYDRLGRRRGSIKAACAKAHVSRQVFYDWIERYLERGLEGLRYPESRAPKHPRELASKLREDAVAVKEEHPTWGLRKVAVEVGKRMRIKTPAPRTIRKALVLAGFQFREGGRKRQAQEGGLRG